MKFDRVTTWIDHVRGNARAKELLLEGKTPFEVETLVGRDTYVANALVNLSREDTRRGVYWQTIGNQFRAQRGLRLVFDANPLAILRHVGITVEPDGAGGIWLDGLDKLEPERRLRCIEYAKRQKAVLLAALRDEGGATW